MELPDGERHLAAIMFTDMVGYTALGQRDESLSLALVEEQRGLIRPILLRHCGREVKTIGDAFLVEFPNALDAVRCAYDIQRAAREFNISMPVEKRIHLRVGLHLGDVVESQGDISGDAVNVASRIQPLAEDGGVCLTRQVYDQVQSKLALQLLSIGPKSLKNVSNPVEVYKVVMPWESASADKEGELDVRRVAVLPFVSMSPDPSDEYFADGMSEELIDRLGQLKDLEVIARTSAMSYKNKDKKAVEIGKELRAGSLLEGSVRKSGIKIRVTVQLIDSNTERHVWSSRYDRDLEDIFSVQTDIAQQVTDALKVRLLPNEDRAIRRNPTGEVEAYSLYVRARHLWAGRTPDGIKKAIEYLEQAIDIDPDYALACALLADCYCLLAYYGHVPGKGILPAARRFAEKAVRIDSALPEVHDAMATLLYTELRVKEAAEEERIAIELGPNYTDGIFRYSLALSAWGRHEEAFHQVKRARDLDPLSPLIAASVAGSLYALGNYDEAIRDIEESLKVIPENWSLFDVLGFALMKKSRYDEGISKLTRAVALSNNSYSVRADLAVGYALSGMTEPAIKILGELVDANKTRFVSPVFLASINAALGRRSDALKWLDVAWNEKDAQMTWILTRMTLMEPVFFDSLGNESRFLALVKEMRKT